MKIFLVGANGQLGQALQLQGDQHDIISVTEDQLDITCFSHVQEMVAMTHPDLVLNAAAYTDVDGAESHVAQAFKVNALGPRNLALATAALAIPLLQISTDYVFDGKEGRPYHEFDTPNPLSVYGASKLAGEEVIRTINPRHFIVRTAWLYSMLGRNFLKTISRLANQPEVKVVSDQFGSPTYVPHLVRALYGLVETRAFGTYHVAGHGSASWFELTCELYQCLGIETPVVPVSTASFPRAAARPSFAVLESIQDPVFRLPPWKDGVAEFTRHFRLKDSLDLCLPQVEKERLA